MQPGRVEVREASTRGGLNVGNADTVGFYELPRDGRAVVLDEASKEEVGGAANAAVEGGITREAVRSRGVEELVDERRIATPDMTVHQVLGVVRQGLIQPGLLGVAVLDHHVLIEVDQVLVFMGEEGLIGIQRSCGTDEHHVGFIAIASDPLLEERSGGVEAGDAPHAVHQVGEEEDHFSVGVDVGGLTKGIVHDRV